MDMISEYGEDYDPASCPPRRSMSKYAHHIFPVQIEGEIVCQGSPSHVQTLERSSAEIGRLARAALDRIKSGKDY